MSAAALLDQLQDAFFASQSPIEIVNAAIAKLDADIAAWDTPEVIEALCEIRRNDTQEYRRIQARLKQWKIATEVEKAIRFFSKKQDNLNNPTYSTLPTLSRPTADFNQHSTSTKPALHHGVLVVENAETGALSLMVESHAAAVIVNALRGFWAWSNAARTWHQFVGTHWEAQSNDGIDRDLIDLLYIGTGRQGFKPGYKNGIKSLIAEGQFLPLREGRSNVLPFNNGLLDLKTKILYPITPDNALTWSLPYSYNPNADCPNIKKWLTEAVDSDKDTVELLRAWMAAVLHGRSDLQKFLHLKGSGGTGKGTFMRLLTALVGEQNAVSSTLRAMENNQFETAQFYGKRLITITDSDKYGGSINTLKALTGEDQLRLERKHQQQAGGFIYRGIVIMASNEFLTTTDHTSGLDRRRSMVEFDRRATDEEKQAWARRGGEAAVIHSELAGLVNWLLELSQDDIGRIIRNPPKRTQDTNLEAMKAANPIAEWLLEHCIPDPSAWTQIGDERRIQEQGEETRYENADTWLYPNYLTWCQRNGRRFPESLSRFRETVIDALKTLGWPVKGRRRNGGMGIQGIRLRKGWETSTQGKTDHIIF